MYRNTFGLVYVQCYTASIVHVYESLTCKTSRHLSRAFK